MDLEGSTYRDPSRFEYEAKEKKIDMESKDNIHAKKRKGGDQGNGSCQKKIKTKAKKNKMLADSLTLDLNENKIQRVGMNIKTTKRSKNLV